MISMWRKALRGSDQSGTGLNYPNVILHYYVTQITNQLRNLIISNWEFAPTLRIQLLQYALDRHC